MNLIKCSCKNHQETCNSQGCGVIRRYGLPDGRFTTKKPLGKRLVASSSFNVGSTMHSPPAWNKEHIHFRSETQGQLLITLSNISNAQNFCSTFKGSLMLISSKTVAILSKFQCSSLVPKNSTFSDIIMCSLLKLLGLYTISQNSA